MSRFAACRYRISLLVAGLSVTLPGLALAHPFLRRSVPAAFDTLAGGPAQLRLVFSEPIEIRFAKVELVGPDGTLGFLPGLATVPDSLGTLTAPVGRVLPPGGYLVRWQAAGNDGHVVRGEYGFTVVGGQGGGEAAGKVVTPGAGPVHEIQHPSSAPISGGLDASSPAFVAVRWTMYLGLLGIIGSIAFQGIVLVRVRRRGCEASLRGADQIEPPVARLGLAATGLFLVTVAGRLFAQSRSMHGADFLDSGLLAGMIAHTMWGWSWMAQLALGAVAFAGFRQAARGQGGWGGLRVVGLLLAFTPAFSGHAIAAERWIPLAVLADGIHVLGASGWLGTLAVLVVIGLSAALGLAEADRGPVAADLVNAFSPVALAFAGTVAASGAFSALVHTGRIADLWETGYGQVLLLKLGVLSVVAGTGAYNWRRVRPVLGDETGARRIRRSATVELMVAVIVLLITGVLVALPTPLAARGP